MNTKSNETIMPDGVSILTLATDEESNAHAPQICTICGNSLKFLGYARKPSKKGDRMAKWPVYELCDKTKHPEAKARERLRQISHGDVGGNKAQMAARLLADVEDRGELVSSEPIRLVRGKSGPFGLLHQYLAGISADDIQDAINKTEERLGEKAKQIHLHPNDLAKVSTNKLGLALVPNTNLSPGHRYIFVVTRPGV